jgi:hypothetical protein
VKINLKSSYDDQASQYSEDRLAMLDKEIGKKKANAGYGERNENELIH